MGTWEIWGYNLHMDTKTHIEIIWDTLCEIHPRLARFDPPQIVFSNRLTKTAGYCHQQTRVIVLAAKFMAKFPKTMLREILPHEIIHQADYDLFGESDKKCGHGANWQMLMLQYGLEPKKYHSMEL